MLPGTHIEPFPVTLLRGSVRGPLGEITQAQRDADAATQAAMLSYAMTDLKARRAEDAKARSEASAQAEIAAAAARWERTQTQALEAAQQAGEISAYTQSAILETSKGSLTKVLVTVGIGLAASYLLFARVFRRKPEQDQ